MKGFNGALLGAIIVSFIALGSTRLYAEHQEHAGKEHAGKEHAGKDAGEIQAPVVQPVEPTNEEIRMAMQTHALEVTHQNGGSFPIYDEKAGKERRLTFQEVHQRVGKLSTKNGYFSCADFVDQESAETLDVDFWVTMEDGVLKVTESEIHKVNGQPRFTYNEKDEKVILN